MIFGMLLIIRADGEGWELEAGSCKVTTLRVLPFFTLSSLQPGSFVAMMAFGRRNWHSFNHPTSKQARNC
jgi:hypothetical protein